MAEIIKLEQAIKLTYSFQDSEIGKGQTICAKFEKRIVEEVLKQENCEGINLYTALTDEGQITFVMVGYDKEGYDMTEGKIADLVNLCPPNKPKESVLIKNI
jgi:hypothetical protein